MFPSDAMFKVETIEINAENFIEKKQLQQPGFFSKICRMVSF